jgi:hypothetical protein
MIKTTQLISLTIMTISLISMVACSSSQNTPSTNQSASTSTEASSAATQQKVISTEVIDLKTTSKSIGEASIKIAKSFKLSFENEDVTQMVLSVKNEASGKHDADAVWVEGELYYAFQQNLPDTQMLVLSEAIAGIPSSAANINVNYKIEGQEMILTAQAIGDKLSGSILAQAETRFELPKSHRRTLVAVLDITSADLKPQQIKAYSNLFRSEINSFKAFDLVSNVDIAKADLMTIQQTTGCKGDQCLSIVGEKLEVDRIITTSYSKIDENVFFITANLTNLQNGSLLISQTEEHDGQSATFKKLLEQLAFKMLGESKQKSIIENIVKVEIKTGKVFVMSRPTSAEIILDGEPLHRKTDALLQDIPAGKHVISLKKGTNFVSKSFEVTADKLTRINLIIADAQENRSDKGGNDARSGGQGRGQGGGSSGGGSSGGGSSGGGSSGGGSSGGGSSGGGSSGGGGG